MGGSYGRVFDEGGTHEALMKCTKDGAKGRYLGKV